VTVPTLAEILAKYQPDTSRLDGVLAKYRQPERRLLPWEDPDNPLRRAGALPTSAVGDLPPDPGIAGPALRRGADAAAGFTVGLAERASALPWNRNLPWAIPEGTRAAMLENLDAEREASLLHGNANARAAILGASEVAGGAAGAAVPGLSLGRAAGAARAGQSVGSNALRGAGVAGTEGLLAGLGETAGQDLETQLLGTGLGTGLGVLAGGAGARAAALRLAGGLGDGGAARVVGPEGLPPLEIGAAPDARLVEPAAGPAKLVVQDAPVSLAEVARLDAPAPPTEAALAKLTVRDLDLAMDAAEAAGDRQAVAAIEREAFRRAGGGPTHATREGMAAPLRPPEFPFQYNARRLDLPKAVADELPEIIRRHLPEIQAQRRAGKGGWEKFDHVESLAARHGMTKEKLLRTKAGKVFNDEQLAVLDSTLGGVAQKMKALADEVAGGADSSTNKAELARLRDEYVALLRVSVGAGSEAGRALASLKAFKRGMSSEGRAQAELLRRYGDRLDDVDIRRIADLDSPEAVADFVRKMERPTFRQLAEEWWYSSILSGIPTHERNILGNIAMAGAEWAIRPVRAGVDAALSATTGKPREYYARETIPAMVGMMHGLQRGIARGAYAFRKGYDPDQPLDELVGKFARTGAFARSSSRTVRAVGAVATVPLRALTAMDTFFKAVNFTSEQYARATRKGIKAGRRGDDLAVFVQEHLDDEDIVAGAAAFSRKTTFTDDPSKFTSEIVNKAKRMVPGLSFIVPFTNIADRLTVRGFEYTPVGAARGVRALRRGDRAAGADLLAKSAVGTATMMGMVGVAMSGRTTADPPRDPAERDRFFAEGKQAWSVKIGDTWVPYGQLEPFATPLALIASAWQSYEENGEEPGAEIAYQVAVSMAAHTLDASYMSSLQDFFDALSRGPSGEAAGKRLAASTLSGFVPASGLQRGIARGMDPRVVDTRAETLAGTVENALRAQTPGLRESLPARQTRFGEDAILAGGAKGSYMASGTPLLTSRETPDPVEQAMEDADYRLGFVGDSIEGTQLSPDQRREYQRTAGQLTRQRLEIVIGSPVYQRADPALQRRMLERTVSDARKRARQEFMRDHLELFR
jgi:hypothetical protein